MVKNSLETEIEKSLSFDSATQYLGVNYHNLNQWSDSHYTYNDCVAILEKLKEKLSDSDLLGLSIIKLNGLSSLDDGVYQESVDKAIDAVKSTERYIFRLERKINETKEKDDMLIGMIYLNHDTDEMVEESSSVMKKMKEFPGVSPSCGISLYKAGTLKDKVDEKPVEDALKECKKALDKHNKVSCHIDIS